VCVCWVPQGSVLDSLLFLVYINDIGDKLLSLSRFFADETSLGYASQDEAQIKYVINNDLPHLRTMNHCLLLFGVYSIDNFQTILVNSLLFHSNSFCVSNLYAKLHRKP
jgi:hypothetical protein